MSFAGVSQTPQADQIRQFKEFLHSYNKITEHCFSDCVQDFTSRKVSASETQCSLFCLQKYLKSTSRISQRFQEHLEGNANLTQPAFVNNMLTFSKWQYIHQKSKALYQICLIEQRRMKYDAVRVRFAPSPTGFLHIGGLRTALYNYMFAKKHKSGQFILRIEDTDQTRVVQDAKENLLSSLEWAGIFPDESFAHGGEYGPYLQSERLHHYQRYADELVENGSAYHCFCTQQRLAILKKDQNKRNEIPRYDNRCRHLSKEDVQEKLASGASSVIRLKHTSGIHTIVDALYGEIGHDLASVEGDSVLLKSDGFPTYHLANVVDDHLMKISHVIRGNEWLLSTPKHALIYKCLGWKEPVFMHLPLLANADGTKLSKRQGDVFVEHYKDQGYTASAILNFIAFYGAGFSDLPTKFPIGINNTAEILEVLTNAFDYNKLLLSKAKVEFHKLIDFSTTLTKRQILSQNKSEIVNDLYKQAALKYREDLFLKQETYSPTEIEHYISSIVDNRKGHIVKLIDLVSEHYKYLWVRPNITSRIHEATVNIVLLNMESFLAGDDHLTKLKKFLVHQAEENNIQFSSLMKLIRKVLTGFEQGPGVQEVIKMLGRREAKFRINSYRNFVCSQNR